MYLRDGGPQQCQVNTTSARRFTGNYRKQAWCKELIEPPGAAPETQPKLAGLAQTEHTLTPTKTALSISPCLLQRVPDQLQPFHETHGGNGCWGQGGTDVSPPAPRHPIQTPHKLEGRTERAGGGAVLRVDTRFFLSLSFSSLLSVSVSEQVSLSALSSHPPSFLLPFLFTHTFTNVQLTNIPALIHHRLSFIGQLEAHTLPHTPNTLAGCVLLPCRCLALRLLFKFSFLSEPTSMCAWMPWYHSPGPGAATFLPSFHPCQTNRRVYVLTSCSQREQHAFCLRLFLPLTFRGRLNESVSIVWKRR